MKNILLFVEDDLILQRMYQTLMKNHGYSVIPAMNGEEGLQKALSEHPDLILLDIRMPKMDGMTMLSKLRQDPWGASAKVIILTNLEPTDNILKGVVENNPTYYLIKSNTKPEIVLEKVNEVFDEQRKIEGEGDNG